MAHRGNRVIDTDTLRISVVLQVSSNDQEREQHSEDYPNVHCASEQPSSCIAREELGVPATPPVGMASAPVEDLIYNSSRLSQ